MKKAKKTSKHKFTKLVVLTGGVIVLLAICAGIYQWTRQPQLTYIPTHMSQAEIVSRLNRINSIYNGFDLGPNYLEMTSSVFGDKRLYLWDDSRSFASSKTYERQANVDVTVAEVTSDIQRAGFQYFENPYPGSVVKESYFKSAKNEYVRLTVSSKPRDDEFRASGRSNINPNQGPSTVVIEVNLDDNND